MRIRAAQTAFALLLGSGIAVVSSPQAAQAARGSADPAVVIRWNSEAVTSVVQAGRANPQAFYWYAFTHLAVHNAVNGITREYRLYDWHKLGPVAASPEAAAAVAAHDVLIANFPAASDRLNAALADSLGRIPDGSAKDQGVRYGRLAAERMIALREGDGRDGALTFDQTPATGVWRPTPPANAPMLVPWVGQLRPFTLESAVQFRPPPPPSVTSALYTRDFAEVARLGSASSPERTTAQTQTARFFSDVPVVALQASLRDLATRQELDISETARLFAAVDTSFADTSITVWNSKHHYGYWRPITAIALADEDQNPDTTAVAGWQPLITTPPYPEYAAGTPSIVSSLATSIPRLLDGGQLDVRITSVAGGTPGFPATRHYTDSDTLRRDVIDARVWGGIHFRNTDEVSAELGRQVTNWVLDHALGEA